MRIMHVTDSYLPCMGGIETHVSDLAARQQAAGHDVRILTATAAEGSSAAGAVPVTRLAWSPVAPGTARLIERFVEAEKVDVVHTHLSIGSPLGWAALRSRLGASRIATMHSVLPDAPRLVRTALSLAGIRADDVVFTAVSEVAARPLRAALGDIAVHVLPNGIDADYWTVGAGAERDGVFTMVSVGRFTRRKRVRPMIDMISDVEAKLPRGQQFRALIVGDGPEFDRVGRDIARHGLRDRVELLGSRSREEIRTILHCADVYLAPARLESFGIAALEARCAGLPVVAMACSGVGEFVTDDVEGFLVSDDAAMADTAVALATGPELLERISRNNATSAPPMSWDRILDLHDEIYDSALAPVRTRRGAYDQVSSVPRN